jgi:hypothetical protein
MRNLLIEIYRSDETEYKPMVSIISEHCDISTKVTWLLDIVKVNGQKINKHIGANNNFIVPAMIDYYVIESGIITIYYKSGFRMEIRRIQS